MPGALARMFAGNRALPRSDTVRATRVSEELCNQCTICRVETRGRVERLGCVMLRLGVNLKVNVDGKPLNFVIMLYFSLQHQTAEGDEDSIILMPHRVIGTG